MPIINLIVTLVIIGVLMWLVNTYIPMAPSIKNLLNVTVIILVVLWLFQVFGLFSMTATVPTFRR